MRQEGTQPRERRQIDIFSAGCPTCNRAIQLVASLAAAEGHEVRIHDMHQEHVSRRAQELGIRSVPAVAIVAAGQQAVAGEFSPLGAMRVAACCSNRGPDEAAIREALILDR